MSNNVDNWKPTREEDIALKEALLTLQKSTDSVLLSPAEQKEEDEQEKKFLLQGHSYFALKAYVMTGKEFPVNGSAFDAKYPEKAFARLLSIDPDIQKETKNGLVAVGSSCSAFYNDKLQNIVRAGSLAVTWSTSTLEHLTDNEDTNLYDYLMVLSDPKYKKLEDRDEAFRKALVGARGCLKLLTRAAEDGKKQADDLRKDLDQFRDATAKLQPDVSALIRKYTAGDQPLLPYLNAEHQKRVQEETKTLDEYNSTFEEWKASTGLAIGVGVSIGWIPLFGWVPLGFLSYNADRLAGSYKRLWESYENLKKENANEALLIESMNNTVKQFDGLEKKILDAIKAVGVLSLMFEQQRQAYELIRTSLGEMGDMADEEDAETRNMFIKNTIKGTQKKLQQLQKAAAGFVKAILTETDMKTLG
ncbi:hypothetical protein BHE90_004108 [Fusarium euwallaceae]|uniref:Uncharacterized protein n=1 Tax=Fusarium euwallaceae TaxID=1147111 RepID=A0A430M0A9_9HYPO|nr:hypothetical protein BHE90_004108 [Fusarium euwallaceae]